jgi:hypothetical protein
MATERAREANVFCFGYFASQMLEHSELNALLPQVGLDVDNGTK